MLEFPRERNGDALYGELQRLRDRVSARRDLRRRAMNPFGYLQQRLLLVLHPELWRELFPTRLWLHAGISAMVPLALALSSFPLTAAPDSAAMMDADTISVAGPMTLNDAAYLGTFIPAGDPPLDSDEALPVPLSIGPRSEVLAPLVVPATVNADMVRVRTGPGTVYDDITRLPAGEAIEVIGRYGEWLQMRTAADPTLRWVAAELISLPEAAFYNLAIVPEASIPLPPPPKVGTVLEDNLNMRDGPGTNYVSMARLSIGTDLSLVEQYDNWFLVEYQQTYGWVTREYLSLLPGVIERIPVADSIPDPNPLLIGTVTENNVNLRKGPGSAYDRVGSTDAASQVTLLAKHKDWYRVELSNGTRAWMYGELLNIAPMAARRVPSTNDIPALPARASGGGAAVNIPASGDVAQYAVQFVGYRYVWGGASPSSGFDCSGLVQYVYRQFGISLPHSAAGQLSTRYGASIGSLSNLQPGDLIFYANTGGRRGITHVSIYIGGGQMVHAMTPAYGVQVSNIWSDYYTSHFAGAIRPYR